MSRVISFRDLRLINALGKYNEIELLHPDRDAEMNFYLSELGFDTRRAILYVPSNHRDMQGNTGIGFRAEGEIDADSPYLDSPLCTLIERILAAAKTDLSLAKEMSMMLGNSINFAVQNSEDVLDDDTEFDEELVEPDYDETSAQLKFLESVRDQLRGDYMNDYGNIKTPEEYHR